MQAAIKAFGWCVVVGLLWVWIGCGGGESMTDGGMDIAGDGDSNDTDSKEESSPPTLQSCTPNQGSTEGNTSVVLSGSGFRAGASVRFGSVVLEASSVRVLSSQQIEAQTPPGSAGVAEVRVTNPDGQRAFLASGFTYVAPIVGDCPRQSNCPVSEAEFSLTTGNSTDRVVLAGDFTGWQDHPIPMTGDSFGRFSVRVRLVEGRYEYKYIVNDTEWRADPNAPTEPIFQNSVLLHDNPCTPKLVQVQPSYGQIFSKTDLELSAKYQDGEAGEGLDPSSICLRVDGKAVMPVWDDAQKAIRASMKGVAKGDHQWWLSAADRAGHRSAEVSGMFTVVPIGEPPIADAGPTQFVYAGSQAMLDATWSRDPDRIALRIYQWQQLEGASVALTSEYVSLREGYDARDGSPIPEPPRTDALKSFTPPSPGRYRFSLTVGDDDGTSAPVTAEVIALRNGANPPKSRIRVSENTNQVTVDGSTSTAGAGLRWYADVRNPAPVTLPADNQAAFSISASTLPADGTYFFYLVASAGATDGLPATAMVKKQGANVLGWNYDDPPGWLPDAQIYEVFVRAFADGDGDGAGDLKGLAGKLDYLSDLGVNTLWLMPVFESSDHAHGYHTVNYWRVERDYGSNADLEDLIRAAHQRQMKVVLDLVINHTSRRHPLFEAAMDPTSRFRDHYIWFQGHSPADPLLQQYGFGRELGGSRLGVQSGWADIPDVNFGNPVARQRFFEVALHWVDPNGDGDTSDGVDGFRLDHVTGPSHLVWRNFRRELKTKKPDVLLLAEVFRDFDNNGQGYGIKDYYQGEFDSAFTFPFYWMAEGVFSRGEAIGGCANSCGLDWLMEAIADRFEPTSVMCFFIENHDVPTGNTVFGAWGRIEGKLIAANTLLQTLPNSPQLLYGQELGTSVWRGPMPWSLDNSQNTLKAAYRELMNLRRDHEALRRGAYLRLPVSGGQTQDVFAFARIGSEETLVVVVNVRGNEAGDVSVDLSPLGATAAGMRDLLTDNEWPVVNQKISTSGLGRALRPYERWIARLAQ